MNPRLHLIIGISFLGIVSVFFWCFSQVDLWASRCFYEEGQFIWSGSDWADHIRAVADVLLWLTIAMTMVGFAAACLWKRHPTWMTRRLCVYVFLGLRFLV